MAGIHCEMARPRVHTVTNQSDLARELDCSAPALKKWLNDDKYAENRPSKTQNQQYRVEEYQAWADFHGLKGKAKEAEDLSRSQQLKLQLDEIKVAREKVRLERERGKLVERSLVPEVYGRSVSYLFRQLDRVLGNELPAQLKGLTEKQMSKLLRDELKRIFAESESEFSNQLEALK